jgi:hypothetical protein
MKNNKYDIKKLEAEEIKLKAELEHWQNYTPVNGMGNWARQTRLDSTKERLDKIKSIVETNETIYLYDILDNGKL